VEESGRGLFRLLFRQSRKVRGENNEKIIEGKIFKTKIRKDTFQM
jgi:hypothetical protein